MTAKKAITLLSQLSAGIEGVLDMHYAEAIDMAIEALEAQKREYTFGTDEFSLEDAYHDCKIVFDGITDDESYQEADTGLILHYANEIIYALRKALEAQKEKTDSISRHGAIDALREEFKRVPTTAIRAKNVIEGLSSAQPEQPEIIRCKDCKFYSPMNRETKTGICNLTMHQNFGDNWFCAGAERRTNATD